MKSLKQLTGFVLIMSMLISFSTAAFADTVDARTVIGADLNSEQVSQVYQLFGIDRGNVKELLVTNAEERSYLSGLISEEIIGTRSISCVYVQILSTGSGMEVTTSNITWCSPEMYMSALATAGITDAKIVVAAPFEVSGTAALTGIYKAYEDITGKPMDSTAKAVSTQELTITGHLAEQIGALESTEIVNELKLILDETRNMTDDELRTKIIEIAAQFNVTLNDNEISQLISLCRSLEALDTNQLKERVENLQQTIVKLKDTQTQIVSFIDRVKAIGETISSLINKIRSWF